MADKTPVRVVFNASNVATGLAEFQTGDTFPIASVCTGLSSIGSAGQVLKVNAAGSGLEFGAEGDISITNLVAPTNADLTFTTSGTGIVGSDIEQSFSRSVSSAQKEIMGDDGECQTLILHNAKADLMIEVIPTSRASFPALGPMVTIGGTGKRR